MSTYDRVPHARRFEVTRCNREPRSSRGGFGVSTVLRELAGRTADTVAGTVGSRLERGRLPADDHRPWPVPGAPWVMSQTWEDLAFLHWPVSKVALDGALPHPLRADTFDGTAWLGVTPFRVTRARARGLPAVLGLSSFHEINVRTYVSVEDKPGVAFFSLDAGSVLAVLGGRSWYALPYFFAIGAATARDGQVRVTSRRNHPGAPLARFVASYRPVGPVTHAATGSLEAWLTERYCLYTVAGDGQLWRAEIHHVPWPLQRAEAQIEQSTLAAAQGVPTSGAPTLVHFARSIAANIWRPRRVTESGRRPRTS